MKNIIDDDGDILNEPYYDDIDNFEDEGKNDRKWKDPSSDLAKKALAICGRTYFRSKKESHEWKMIEKACVSLDTGIVSMYPLEWIENIFRWAEKKNRIQTVIVFPAMISAIKNKADIVDFVAKYRKEKVITPVEIKKKQDFKKEKFDW